MRDEHFLLAKIVIVPASTSREVFVRVDVFNMGLVSWGLAKTMVAVFTLEYGKVGFFKTRLAGPVAKWTTWLDCIVGKCIQCRALIESSRELSRAVAWPDILSFGNPRWKNFLKATPKWEFFG